MHLSYIVVTLLAFVSSPCFGAPTPRPGAWRREPTSVSKESEDVSQLHYLDKRFLFTLLGGLLNVVPIVGPLLGTPLIMIDEAIAKAINKKKEAPKEAAAAMDEALEEISSLEAMISSAEFMKSTQVTVGATPSPFPPLRVAIPTTLIPGEASTRPASPTFQAYASYTTPSTTPCSEEPASTPLTYYHYYYSAESSTLTSPTAILRSSSTTSFASMTTDC